MPIAIQHGREDVVIINNRSLWKAENTGDLSDIPADRLGVWQNWLVKDTDPNAYGPVLAEFYGTGVVDDPKYSFANPVFFGVTETMERTWATLSAMENETIMKIIHGEADISAFDTFVDNWRKLGGDDIIKEITDTLK